MRLDLLAHRARLIDMLSDVQDLKRRIRHRPSIKDLHNMNRALDSMAHPAMGDHAYLDALDRRRRWKRVRRWVFLAALAAGFVEYAGLPNLRMTYRSVGTGSTGRVIDATYWGMTGTHHIRAGQHAAGCPLVLLIPLERPLWSYAHEAAQYGWDEASTWLHEQWNNLRE